MATLLTYFFILVNCAMFDLFFNPPKIQIVKHQICPVKLNEQKFGATMYFLEDLKDNYLF